jgi:hypothetical protein
MENTLLTVGLACLLALIVGGGLKAFGIEIPLLTTWPRQIALFVFGLALCFIAFAVRPKPIPPPSPPPRAKQQAVIRYAQRGGPFIELGEGGSKRYSESGYWWHAMDIRIENQCADPIHIEAGDFRLYLASKASTENAASYASETITPYSRKLPSGWVGSGMSIEGRLVFQVPERLPNGSESNGSYHIVRTYTQSQCPLVYQPY